MQLIKDVHDLVRLAIVHVELILLDAAVEWLRSTPRPGPALASG